MEEQTRHQELDDPPKRYEMPAQDMRHELQAQDRPAEIGVRSSKHQTTTEMEDLGILGCRVFNAQEIYM